MTGKRAVFVRLLVGFVDADGRQHGAGERLVLPADVAGLLIESGGAEAVNDG